MNTQAGPVQELRVHPLHAAAVPGLLRLQQAVCRQLAMPELYFPLRPAEMQELVGPDGVCLGLSTGSELLGFVGLLFMGERPGNIGLDLGLPSQSLPRVAYLNTINIAPSWQGRGLQKPLQRALLETLGAQLPAALQACSPAALMPQPAPQARPWQWLCSTVSPHNLPSLQAHFGSGFRIAGLQPKYRGYMRYLLIRGPGLAPHSTAPGVWADVLDYATQTDLLARGWTGVQMAPVQARPHIQYQRLPEASHD